MESKLFVLSSDCLAFGFLFRCWCLRLNMFPQNLSLTGVVLGFVETDLKNPEVGPVGVLPVKGQEIISSFEGITELYGRLPLDNVELRLKSRCCE